MTQVSISTKLRRENVSDHIDADEGLDEGAMMLVAQFGGNREDMLYAQRPGITAVSPDSMSFREITVTMDWLR